MDLEDSIISHNKRMNETDKNNKIFDVLFPSSKEKTAFQGGCYSSRPALSFKNQLIGETNEKLPSFVNVIQLKTFDSNLSLEFAFTQNPEKIDVLSPQLNTASIIISSETGKQLLIALADLYQCDLSVR
jgi:hypothetical protein